MKMKKNTTLGLVAIASAIIGTLFGEKLLAKVKSSKLLGSKIAGDDDYMGSDDPIVEAAKNL